MENTQVHHAELKNDFSGDSYVENSRYVFNLKGDRYKIIAIILFVGGIMTVRRIDTHGEYDKIVLPFKTMKDGKIWRCGQK